MDRKFFRRWAWIVFLLPFLVGGDLPKKDSGGVWTDMHGDLQEGNELALPLDAPLPKWLSILTESIAFENGLSPKLVKSIILTESNGDSLKVSPKGAKGLMQLMPLIVKEYEVLDPHDPVANIQGGVRYLKNLLEEFSGDLYLALAAYNAGTGAVRKYRGIPPFRETQEFVRRVSEIFHSGEESPHFVPSTLRTSKAGALPRSPAKFLLGGHLGSLGLFREKMSTEVNEIRNQ